MRCPYAAKGRFICVLGLAIFVFCAAGCKKKPAPPPPPEVQVITLAATNVPIFEDWIGTLDGDVNAQIRAQVTGYLLSQNYKEGSLVKKGDLMFQIDPRPFQAVLDQGKAKLAQDQAQQGKAQLDVDRYTPLAKEQAISQEQLDDAVQANLAAIAQVKADDATIESAQLNLGFTRIISPIEGIAGVATAQVGDLVGQSGNALTTVSSLDPIRVYFQVGEQSYRNFWVRHADPLDTAKGLSLELVFGDNTVYSRKGKFFFANRQVDPQTGTLQIAGLFPNPDLVLRPGQYGRVRAETYTRTNVIMLPQRAVAELQGGYQVVTVDEQNKSHLQPVQVGEQVGSNWIVNSGLKPGDRVIVEGTQKAREGTVVNPVPYGTGSDQSSQTETNSSPANQSK